MASEIMFLFGAGAEQFAKLPTGGEYTKRTILTKNTILYGALRKFYAESAPKTNPYKGVYMFTKSSHTLFEIISRALSCYDIENGEPYSENENLNRLLKKYKGYRGASDSDKQTFKKNIRYEVYSAITQGESGGRSLDDYADLVSHFSYYGAIEKDFASLISPEKAGKDIFWR